ncbi:MAG: cellulase family glycosylhydrolase [Polyangiaceae bacterium]|nr:cellulase family glycosylhydrolase [Polyangiaceae bacterium]
MLTRSYVPLAALLVLGCSSAGDPEPTVTPGAAPWSTGAGAIRDEAGRAVVLRGVNLAGSHKQAPYVGVHTREDYVRLSRDWGMNHIRFLVLWAGLEPEKGQWDDAYLDEIAERMDWAHEAGLRVVLDMHQDVYGEGFYGDGAPRWTCAEAHYAAFTPRDPWFTNYLDPEVIACVDGFWGSEELRAHYAEAWVRVARRLGSHPAVLGFDPMNEPFWGTHPTTTFDAEVLQPYFESLAIAIREEAPDWLAFFEPFAGRNLGFPTSFGPFGVPGVVYSPHAYDTDAESGAPFDAKARDALLARIQRLRADADLLGVPLWIGEYGGTSDLPGIVPYVDAARDGAAAMAAGSAYWSYDLGGGYSLLEADGSEKQHVVDRITLPYPERVAGDLTSWEWDEPARRLRVRMTPRLEGDAPTILSVPDRVYPAGYQVVAPGGSVTQEPGRALVRLPRGDQEVVLEVTPR